jgi:serine/threonine protein kinase
LSEDPVDSRLGLPVNTVLDGSYRIERVVGSGGFGITYEAEDINLATKVAIKEYYPFDFGDRDSTMSVKPKSDRHQKTFQWGRTNFLQEARTLARFEHPSVVRVTRVFEANSTAYMVMRFEQGRSFEDWLRGLGRPPTQEELDSIVAPLLDALQMMHAENFLHRDIAPDNIIVRADGTPVLLDFGAARRAVAEMSRTLTGIVKAGYSPHEQYSSDNRLQGPWSDLYALGGTLYRAVSGKAPEEATLRVDQDHVQPAAKVAKGAYRPEFLSAIDACLKVRHSERPRSVAQLRPLMLGDAPQSRSEVARSRPRSSPPGPQATRKLTTTTTSTASRPMAGRSLAIAAAVIAILGGSYGGLEYMRWQPSAPGAADAEVKRAAEAEARRKAVAEAAQRQAEVDAERRRQDEAAAVAQRQASAEAERQRRETAEAAERQASLDLERQRREAADAAQRQADADAERAAAEENARREAAAEEERRRADDNQRVASLTLNADDRAAFVKRIQTVLKQGRCYDGAINGRVGDTQSDTDRFVATTSKMGRSRPMHIELAKATASDFEAWLRDAAEISGDVCVPKARPPKPEVVRPARHEPTRQARQREEAPRARPERRAAEPRESSSSGGGGKVCFGGGRTEIVACK